MNRITGEAVMTDSPKPGECVGWELIWRSGDIPPRYRTLAEPNASVVDWAETLPAGGFVLDVGCGVGRHTVYLGGRGFRVAGTDISPTGIQMTLDGCTERSIEFDGRVADLTALPWADATFDAALSTATMHHNLRANIFKSLYEVRRVLKPGGLFLVDFPSVDREDMSRLRHLAASGEISEPEPNTFIDDRPDSDDGDGFLPHHYVDEADARDLLRAFDILKLESDAAGNRGRWVAWVRKPLSD
jgi:tellurite methyltransferase